MKTYIKTHKNIKNFLFSSINKDILRNAEHLVRRWNGNFYGSPKFREVFLSGLRIFLEKSIFRSFLGLAFNEKEIHLIKFGSIF